MFKGQILNLGNKKNTKKPQFGAHCVNMPLSPLQHLSHVECLKFLFVGLFSLYLLPLSSVLCKHGIALDVYPDKSMCLLNKKYAFCRTVYCRNPSMEVSDC